MADVSRDIVTELAPTGTLRTAINFGNSVLAQPHPSGGEPQGVSSALARELAKRLGVPISYVPFDAAGKVTDAGKAGLWDICFLAVDPVRAAGIAFTAPYVVIEGVYVVPANSGLRSAADVDRAEVRVAVAKGSAYDLYLTRNLKQATLVREALGPDSLDRFVNDKLEAAAGVRQPMAAFVNSRADMRLIPGRFMAIEQAMGTPRGRAAGVRYLRQFVEEMKASGFVARALKDSGQADASVAPPEPVT
jgi:polar amino acid transport system substrate-binding protein